VARASAAIAADAIVERWSDTRTGGGQRMPTSNRIGAQHAIGKTDDVRLAE
jgi:hypothetical protein